MRYYVVVDGRNVAEIEVEEGSELVVIETSEGTPVAGLDAHADGTVTMGHWPDGEEWVSEGCASPIRY